MKRMAPPIIIPINSFVIGVTKITVPIRNVRYMATPPKRDVGTVCHLSSLGLATFPYRSAVFLVIKVKNNERITEKINGAI